MRSVCGCIPASSAATEITNTARRWGSSERGRPPPRSRRRAGPVHFIGHGSSSSQVGADVLGIVRPELFDQLLDVPTRLGRHDDLGLDEEVARLPVGRWERRDPALGTSCRSSSRRGSSGHRPVHRRDLDLGSERSLGERDRDGEGEVVAAPSEQRCASTDTVTRRSPGGPPLRPGPPFPGSRIVAPSFTPAGIFTLMSRARLDTSPPTGRARGLDEPPAPRHCGQVWGKAKSPWLWATCPAPLQVGQVVTGVPGSAPLPPQRRHAASPRTETVVVTP
jgi:hypothetical protein